jgi:phosphoglycolate phosphatase
MASPRTIVFDLDGTLVDTAADLVGALNSVLGLEGLPAIDVEEAVPMVGFGAKAMLEKALAASGRPISGAALETMTRSFIDHYASHIADESRPFPGTAEMLDRFGGDGWRLAVCTNKLESLARRLLETLGLSDRFEVIAGQDTFGIRKPDPRHLTMTIAAVGGQPSGAVMVGDSEIDVETARAAGVPIVAVEFGYSTIPAAELGADRVINHFDALFETANELVPARSRRSASGQRG